MIAVMFFVFVVESTTDNIAFKTIESTSSEKIEKMTENVIAILQK